MKLSMPLHADQCNQSMLINWFSHEVGLTFTLLWNYDSEILKYSKEKKMKEIFQENVSVRFLQYV